MGQLLHAFGLDTDRSSRMIQSKLSALGLDVNRSLFTVHDRPLMPVSYPKFYWVSDRPQGRSPNVEIQFWIFFNRLPRLFVFCKIWKWVRTFWNTFENFIWVHSTSLSTVQTHVTVEISLFTHDRPPIDHWDDAFDLNWISLINWSTVTF